MKLMFSMIALIGILGYSRRELPSQGVPNTSRYFYFYYYFCLFSLDNSRTLQYAEQLIFIIMHECRYYD